MARAHAILRGMSSSPPPCPKHPTAARLNARVPGAGRSWVCMVCGAATGAAPEREGESREFERVTLEDVGEVDARALFPTTNTDDLDTLPE